jgi:hypothetical protein
MRRDTNTSPRAAASNDPFGEPTEAAAADWSATRERMQKRARRMNRLNVPMRVLLRLPFDTVLSRQLMLVDYRGVKSGRLYRQPVSYVTDGDVLLTPGGGRWKTNLRAGQQYPLRLRGRKVRATVELVRDIDEVESLLVLMATRNRRLARFVPCVNSDGTVERVGLTAALQHGFCIVKWTTDRPVSPRG